MVCRHSLPQVETRKNWLISMVGASSHVLDNPKKSGPYVITAGFLPVTSWYAHPSRSEKSRRLTGVNEDSTQLGAICFSFSQAFLEMIQ